jgi:hypothetical protein
MSVQIIVKLAGIVYAAQISEIIGRRYDKI